MNMKVGQKVWYLDGFLNKRWQDRKQCIFGNRFYSDLDTLFGTSVPKLHWGKIKRKGLDFAIVGKRRSYVRGGDIFLSKQYATRLLKKRLELYRKYLNKHKKFLNKCLKEINLMLQGKRDIPDQTTHIPIY